MIVLNAKLKDHPFSENSEQEKISEQIVERR